VSFIIPVVGEGNFNENFGSISLLLLIIAVPIAIIIAGEAKNTFDTSKFDLTYTYFRFGVIPFTSIILTVISLVWMWLDSQREYNTETAMAFVIGFGMLAVFEYLVQVMKAYRFNGFTFSFDQNGVIISKGSWHKQYLWNHYDGFTTAYKARFGNFLRYVPLLSLLASESDQHTIRLIRKKEYATAATYDEIMTMTKNNSEVINYISRFIPENNKINLGNRF
jgi:hypothetical protein